MTDNAYLIQIDTRSGVLKEYTIEMEHCDFVRTHNRLLDGWERTNESALVGMAGRKYWQLTPILNGLEIHSSIYLTNHVPPVGRHPSWSKLQWVLEQVDRHFKGFDDKKWLLILDSDAWVRPGKGEELIKTLDEASAAAPPGPGQALVFATEPTNIAEAIANDCDGIVNGGFLAVNIQCPYVYEALEFLREHAWNASVGTKYLTEWPFEQKLLSDALRRADAPPFPRVPELNTPSGRLIRHVWFDSWARLIAMDDLLISCAMRSGSKVIDHVPTPPANRPCIDLVISRYNECLNWIMDVLNDKVRDAFAAYKLRRVYV